MKSIQSLLLAAVLPLLVPAPSSAGLIGSLLDPILSGGDGSVAPVPEPSGAIVMGAALLTLGVVRRMRRK
jgi:hypothetical protein